MNAAVRSGTSMRESFARVPAPEGAGKPRKIDNNTFEYTHPDGSRIVRLHVTDIVTVMPGNRVRLNSGGWLTPTTKARMNDVLGKYGYTIFSGKGAWFVRRPHMVPDPGTPKEVPYFDGMILPDDFKKPKKGVVEKQVKLKADIKKFVEKTIVDGKPLPMPGNGDCWYCLMFDQEPKRGERNGLGWTLSPEASKQPRRDADHLLEHIKDNYMHGSLILNALRAAGVKDENAWVWTGWGCPDGKPLHGYADVRRFVRRYLGKRLGLAV